MDGLRIFTNDQKTRTFVSLDVARGRAETCAAIQAVDGVLARYGQPKYYEDPQPHATVASALGNCMSATTEHELAKKFFSEQETARHEGCEHARATAIRIRTVHCKIGNKLFQIPLKS
jgi:hypothetical protein